MLSPKFALNWTSGTAQPGVDVVRAGVATYTDSNTLLQSAPADTQRVDWSTGTPGLLIEESRANLFLYSQNFADASWTKTRVTVTANAITSPSGNNDGFKLVETADTGNHQITQSPAFSTLVDYGFSCYAKAGERTKIRLHWNGTTTALRADVDLITGQVLSGTNVKVQNAGDGWWRISKVMQRTSANPLCIAILDDAGAVSYTGDPTKGLYIQFSQFELGSFTTSYIPTEASSVTRNADVATITGTNFSDFWQASKGGAQVQATPSTVSGIRPLVQYDDGTADNIIALRGNAANPELQIVDGGASQVQLDAGTIVANTPYSLTAWWSTDDCKARQNSGAVVTDTSATTPTVTQARLGSDGTNYLNGHLETIKYYNRFSSQIYDRRKNKAISSLL